MAPSDFDTAGGAPVKPPQSRRRSLRAVFAADVAGFSSRMSLNETGTVTALSEIRTIGRRELENHNGWLFGMPGDGLFALFESAVAAVQCALSIQLAMSERPHLRETPLRIGIHLGEVLIDNDLPYGETLNIAARLEALADPGGILVSGTVMDAVSARVSARFEDRGVPQLKNIPRRISTFAVKQPPARSPADETQAGLSNLDRTTRLDRNALREIMSEYGAPGAAKPAAPREDGSLQTTAAPAAPSASGPVISSEPVTAPPPAPVGTETPVEQAVSVLADVPIVEEPAVTAPVSDHTGAAQSCQSVTPPEDKSEPSAGLPVQPPDQPKSLVEKLDELPPASTFEMPPLSTAKSGSAPHAPVLPAAPLEKTLPQISELPSEVEVPAPERRPSQEFLDQITTALAVHVGPFAKLIVQRQMASDPGVFDLISKLEEHIPAEDERLVFRVRASQINVSLSASEDDGA